MALSLFDSGNAFSSLPAVTATGGSSVLSSGSGSRVVGRDGTTGVSSPVTSESVTNTEQQQQQKKKGITTETATRQATQDQIGARDLQSVSDPILNLINQQAGVLGSGANSTLSATDAAREANIAAVLDRIAGFDQQAVLQGAEGNVQQLNRELLEDILPQITGAVEAGGGSNNALAALLAQDAASRTAEAGARVREQARSNSEAEFINMINAAQGAAAGGSAQADTIANLINAAKGTVDTGIESTSSVGNETLQGTTDVDETVDTATQGTTAVRSSDASDAAAIANQNRMAQLALLQSALSPFQTLQDLTGGTRGFGATSAARDSTNSINRLAVMLGL